MMTFAPLYNLQKYAVSIFKHLVFNTQVYSACCNETVQHYDNLNKEKI